jgi:hypothetical protein
MRNWRPEDIFEVACPSCGDEIEFWKDEPFRTCSACSLEVQNPRVDFGCAKWCKFAEECLGSERAATIVGALMRDQLVAEVREACGGDQARLGRALQLLEKAEQLIEAEGGEALVIKAAALLRDIDARDAASAASAILEKLGVDTRTSHCVCQIIESLHGAGAAARMNTLEARILRDAQRLMSLSRGREAVKADQPAADAFETPGGRELAGELLLRRDRDPAS